MQGRCAGTITAAFFRSVGLLQLGVVVLRLIFLILCESCGASFAPDERLHDFLVGIDFHAIDEQAPR